MTAESFQKIRLSCGAEFLVDKDLPQEILLQSWRIGSGGYVLRHRKIDDPPGGPDVVLHREIAELHGMDTSAVIDHINMNRLDNRAANLRPCSISQNLCNRGAPSTNTSGYKGVYKVKKGERSWKSHIVVNKKQYYLGVFYSAEEAAYAYDLAALTLHGEFAYLNFPEISSWDRKGEVCLDLKPKKRLVFLSHILGELPDTTVPPDWSENKKAAYSAYAEASLRSKLPFYVPLEWERRTWIEMPLEIAIQVAEKLKRTEE